MAMEKGAAAQMPRREPPATTCPKMLSRFGANRAASGREPRMAERESARLNSSGLDGRPPVSINRYYS